MCPWPTSTATSESPAPRVLKGATDGTSSDGRLAGGDTLVVVAIDRIGRTWQDILRTICELRDRGVKIRSLPKRRPSGPSTWRPTKVAPEAFFGQVLTMFAAWVADQELQSVKRRTKEELERAREQGKILGLPRKFTPNQVETMREDAGGRGQPAADRQ